MTENAYTPNRDIPAPKYKVLDTVEADGGARRRSLVKLGQPHIARLLTPERGAKSQFAEVEYVHVTSTRQEQADASGSFVYNETAVTASDEDGKEFQAYLYFAHRALEVDEAMFAIGEI